MQIIRQSLKTERVMDEASIGPVTFPHKRIYQSQQLVHCDSEGVEARVCTSHTHSKDEQGETEREPTRSIMYNTRGMGMDYWSVGYTTL